MHSLAVAPGSPVTTWAATEQGIYRQIGSRPWKRVLADSEVWSVSAPETGLVLAADNQGRILISRDGGQEWRSRELTSLGAYAVSTMPQSPSRILVGAGGGIYLSTDAGVTWTRVARLGDNATDAFAWSGNTSMTVFAANVSGGSGSPAPPVMVSRDAGRTWMPFGSHLTPAGVMSLLILGRSTILAGTMGHALWRSGQTREDWRWSGGNMPRSDDHGAGFAIVPGRPIHIFTGTEGRGVFESTDDGREWINESVGLPSTGEEKLILGLAYRPSDGSLLAGTPDGVYALRMGR